MSKQAYEQIRTDEDGAPVFKVGALEVRKFDTMAANVRTFVVDVAGQIASASDDVALEIVNDILTAETADAILGDADVMHAEEIIDVPVTVHAVKWQRSGVGAGLPFYALMTISHVGKDDTKLCSCSATNVMAQLWQLQRIGLLPVDVRLVTSKRPTADGFYPMRLVNVSPDAAF